MLAWLRNGASPRAAAALLRMNSRIDVRDVLPTIQVPTLILHRVGDRDVNVEEARYLAERIPGARLVELPGDEHAIAAGDVDRLADELEEFLTGARPAPEPDRVLTTVLFTDIVGSTDRAVALGDREWGDLLERHHSLVRAELVRHRGREVDTAGDGFLATFDGPARAVQCACAIRDAVRTVGLEVRAGVHTGEVQLRGEGVAGIAVHTGARIAGLAGPGEVLVSRTVTDLTAGSGLVFEPRGEHELKGVPGSWQVHAVAST
jgi:class 3 adenylate cyclase